MQAVSAFCKSQEIDDIDNFIYLCFKQGFDIKKYGLLGDNSEKTSEIQEKWVEKEVIVEKRVEIPVEVVKEVEKIVEVPVEVIKEVPVEKVVTKIEYISDKTSENELLLKIQQLESEMSKKDENLDEFRRDLDEVLDKPPVEIIKEVEVVKEVEKIVTKIEYIRDETKINNLSGMIEELTKELDDEKNNIKTIEVVKEVQVVVEKEVETSNDKSKMLENTLQNLRKELSLKNDRIKDLEEINKQLESIKVNQGAIFLKGSNLTQNL